VPPEHAITSDGIEWVVARDVRPEEPVPGQEDVCVASGVFHDGVRDDPAGTLIHHPTGSVHVPSSPSGCTLFVFHPEG
jgi:hypothetical protein